MERGLIESNLQVEFSFTPVDNKLTTTKTVNTVNVNDGIKDAVAAADSFTFTNVNNGSSNTDHSPLGSKEYFHTEKSGSTSSMVSGTDGSYSMKNGSSAVFTNITDVGNWLTVSESMNDSFIKYSSSTYSVTDVNNGVQKGSGSGTSANFLFKNEVNEKHATDYKVDFVNTPQLSNLDVSKSAFDNVMEGMCRRAARSCTPAFNLLDTISATLIFSFLEKYSAMFSAFVPVPEAKMAIFFMTISVLVHKKIKNVQFISFFGH